MPGYQTAKQCAEKALMTIGAFPASREQANAAELKRSLMWLEMVLNSQSGIRTMAGFWRVYEIPVEAGIGDYLLSDYDNAAGTQQVFLASLVNALGDPVCNLDILWEDDAVKQPLSETGTPNRIIITRNRLPEIKAYPTPTQNDEDTGYKIRVRVQTFHPEIDSTGVADSDLLIRPSWYLWMVKRLAYEIGNGPVRRLPEAELRRIQGDYTLLEAQLTARDGQYNTGRPPVTEPMVGG